MNEFWQILLIDVVSNLFDVAVYCSFDLFAHDGDNYFNTRGYWIDFWPKIEATKR